MECKVSDLVKRGHDQAAELKSSCGAVDVRDVAQLISDLATQLDVQLVRSNALAAEYAYLLNGAARELNTSWMFHKTMLGAQAALVCLSHGYQAAAREWLEGTTDEAGAEIPDDISVGELHEWFDRQMVSNDGKSGFLTRSEAEEAIRKACPATDAFLAEVRASARNEGINYAASRLAAAFNHGFLDKPVSEVLDVTRMILSAKEDLANAPLPAADGLSGEYAEKAIEEWAAQLRKGVAQ
ncbi:hypothetical protein GNM61_15530 [Salmonella enterica]|nr:hypothetical protein [Salmonella enterica]